MAAMASREGIFGSHDLGTSDGFGRGFSTRSHELET
jgi:hypothetical protein